MEVLFGIMYISYTFSVAYIATVLQLHKANNLQYNKILLEIYYLINCHIFIIKLKFKFKTTYAIKILSDIYEC